MLARLHQGYISSGQANVSHATLGDYRGQLTKLIEMGRATQKNCHAARCKPRGVVQRRWISLIIQAT